MPPDASLGFWTLAANVWRYEFKSQELNDTAGERGKQFSGRTMATRRKRVRLTQANNFAKKRFPKNG